MATGTPREGSVAKVHPHRSAAGEVSRRLPNRPHLTFAALLELETTECLCPSAIYTLRKSYIPVLKSRAGVLPYRIKSFRNNQLVTATSTERRRRFRSEVSGRSRIVQQKPFNINDLSGVTHQDVPVSRTSLLPFALLQARARHVHELR
jgi:hypothetical protein